MTLHTATLVIDAQESFRQRPYGVTSGIDLALVLSAREAGAVTAARVARDLVVYIRRAIARERLQTTHMTIERIAESAGFRSALQLRRLWKKHGEGSPRHGRKSVSTAQ